MNLHNLSVKDFMHDATSQGFVISNKNNSIAEYAENDPLTADVIMHHPEKNMMLTMNGGLEEPVNNAFLFMTIDKEQPLHETEKLSGSFFYTEAGTGNHFGFVDVKDDLFDGLKEISDLELKTIPMSLERDSVSLLPVWGDLEPLTMGNDEIANELHQQTGEFFEKIFDVPEATIDQVYARAQEQSNSYSRSR
jgi:hypothetical protein